MRKYGSPARTRTPISCVQVHYILLLHVEGPNPPWESKLFLAINTPRGLYQYQRLPYGVASAPAIWQRATDQILQGIPVVFCYLEDVIMTGSTVAEHVERIYMVLRKLEEYGLKANREKCKFLRSFVEYLGYVISPERLHQSSKKAKAITEMPNSQDVT